MSNPRIQLRHDTAENWSTVNPVLLDGEVGIEKTSKLRELYTKVGTPIITSGILSNISSTNYIQINIPSVYDVCIKYKSSSNTSQQSLLSWGESGENTPIYTESNGDLYFYSNNPEVSLNLQTNISTNTNYFIRVKKDNNSTVFRVKVSTDDETIDEALADSSGWVETVYSNYDYFADRVYNIGYTPHNNWIWSGTVDLSNSQINDKKLYQYIYGYTGLKIGDGETAWNDLPYII